MQPNQINTETVRPLHIYNKLPGFDRFKRTDSYHRSKILPHAGANTSTSPRRLLPFLINTYERDSVELRPETDYCHPTGAGMHLLIDEAQTRTGKPHPEPDDVHSLVDGCHSVSCDCHPAISYCNSLLRNRHPEHGNGHQLSYGYHPKPAPSSSA
jgi:hypothetical protein